MLADAFHVIFEARAAGEINPSFIVKHFRLISDSS